MAQGVTAESAGTTVIEEAVGVGLTEAVMNQLLSAVFLERSAGGSLLMSRRGEQRMACTMNMTAPGSTRRGSPACLALRAEPVLQTWGAEARSRSTLYLRPIGETGGAHGRLLILAQFN